MEPLLMEKTQPKKSCSFDCWTTVMSGMNLLLTVIIISIVSTTIVDVIDTFKDIQLIVPEVKKGLDILQGICANEEFKKFCHA